MLACVFAVHPGPNIFICTQVLTYVNGTESEMRFLPYCHECGLYTREYQRSKMVRDVLRIADLWGDPKTPTGQDKWFQPDSADGGFYRSAIGYGGLLGAIRGLGYIPWDFDCDFYLIAMNVSLDKAIDRYGPIMSRPKNVEYSIHFLTPLFTQTACQCRSTAQCSNTIVLSYRGRGNLVRG